MGYLDSSLILVAQLSGRDRRRLCLFRIDYTTTVGRAGTADVSVCDCCGGTGPTIPIGIENRTIRLGRYVPFLHGRINFLIIAFAYFTDLQVLLSIWVFWVLAWIQIGVTNRIDVVEGVGDFGGGDAAGARWVHRLLCLGAVERA